jgi:hypothetical protein
VPGNCYFLLFFEERLQTLEINFANMKNIEVLTDESLIRLHVILSTEKVLL